MGYHNKEIPKGELGEVSKIKEEMMEFVNAVDQKAKILIICELCDVVGAIELYVQKHHNLSLADVIQMKDLTAKAFLDGSRASVADSTINPCSEIPVRHFTTQPSRLT